MAAIRRFIGIQNLIFLNLDGDRPYVGHIIQLVPFIHERSMNGRIRRFN